MPFERTHPKQVFVSGDEIVGSASDCAFEDAVVIRVVRNGANDPGWASYVTARPHDQLRLFSVFDVELVAKGSRDFVDARLGPGDL